MTNQQLDHMLHWSVLHLTGTRAVNADYERLGHGKMSTRFFARKASRTGLT
jgi:hypothetical protein